MPRHPCLPHAECRAEPSPRLQAGKNMEPRNHTRARKSEVLAYGTSIASLTAHEIDRLILLYAQLRFLGGKKSSLEFSVCDLLLIRCEIHAKICKIRSKVHEISAQAVCRIPLPRTRAPRSCINGTRLTGNSHTFHVLFSCKMHLLSFILFLTERFTYQELPQNNAKCNKKRPHQQNEALRAPFLPAFFC